MQVLESVWGNHSRFVWTARMAAAVQNIANKLSAENRWLGRQRNKSQLGGNDQMHRWPQVQVLHKTSMAGPPAPSPPSGRGGALRRADPVFDGSVGAGTALPDPPNRLHLPLQRVPGQASDYVSRTGTQQPTSITGLAADGQLKRRRGACFHRPSQSPPGRPWRPGRCAA